MFDSTLDKMIIPRGMTSVIGSGGKTSLLRYLANTLKGTVILTTSTHMYPFEGMPLINTMNPIRNSPVLSKEKSSDYDRNQDGRSMGDTSASTAGLTAQIQDTLAKHRVICLGALQSSGKLGSPEDALSFDQLLSLADYVIVEADGSKTLPLKAHRSFEPVIPSCSALTICVVGASGIGKPLQEVCHCPELFAALAGISTDTLVRPEHIASVLNQEDLADLYYVNQIDTLPDPTIARKLCDLIHNKTYAGSLLHKT